MTGRLVIQEVPQGPDGYYTGLTINRTVYPEIRLLKSASPTGTGVDWRIYVSGTNTDTAPALSFFARNATGATTGSVFRIYANRIVQMEGTPVTLAGEVGTVLKFRDGVDGDDRGIGIRDMRDYGHPAGAGLAAINYPEQTLAPLSVASPNYPYQAVTRAYLETFTAGVIAFSDGWSNYGGTYGNVQPVLSTNGMVTMEGLFRHAAGRAVTEGTTYSLGALPAGYRPATTQIVPGYGANPHQAIRINVEAAGTMSYIPTETGTLGYLSFSGNSWRAA